MIITNSLNTRDFPQFFILSTTLLSAYEEPFVSAGTSGVRFAMRPLFLLLLFLAVVGGQDIRDVDNHNALFHAISNYACDDCTVGNNIVPNGAIVRAAQGTYIGAPYAYSNLVYYIVYNFFLLFVRAPRTHVFWTEKTVAG